MNYTFLIIDWLILNQFLLLVMVLIIETKSRN